MGGIEGLAAALRLPMPLLQQLSGHDVASLRRLGFSADYAAELLSAHEALFGDSAFAAMQRQARADIERHGHSLDVVLFIESFVTKIRLKRHDWRVRAAMCATKGDKKQLARVGQRVLGEVRGAREVLDKVALRRHDGGKASLVVTGPAEQVLEMYAPFKQAEAPVEAVHRALTGGEGAGVTTVLTPHVVIPLGALTQIRHGAHDVELVTTHGARINGQELVKRTLADAGFVTLVHPVEGPVNLYHTQRAASWKQTLMAWAENPECPVEGCRVPAEEAQIHHMKAVKHGGQTNSKNLSTCCAFHNGRNDDDPNAPPRNGHLARINGRVQRVFGPHVEDAGPYAPD